VTSILENQDLAKRMGENARRRVLEMFSWEEAAKSVIRTYEEVLQKAPSEG